RIVRLPLGSHRPGGPGTIVLATALTPRAPHVTPVPRPGNASFPSDKESATMTQAHWDGLTRRRFLQTGAAATLGLAGVPAMLHADDKADAFGGFTFGVQ